jgi:hypothetical protein
MSAPGRDEPLEIRLAAPRPKTAAGEGIILLVEQRVFRELEMQDVELNRGRSRLYLTRLDDEALPTTELTGDDYARLHHVGTFEAIGSPFTAPAGSEWSNELHLLRYTYPLPAGRYRVALTYHWGSEEDEIVRTNPVDIDVAPTNLATVCDRWFGGGDPRDELGSLWTTPGGRWYYQIANRMDPRALRVSVDLNMPPVSYAWPPRLAHVNDIAGVQFDRWALWTEPGRLGWLKLAYIGRTGEPVRVEHGLAADPSPIIAEPPLQPRAGGFRAMLAGLDNTGNAAASLIALDGLGNLDHRPISLPGAQPAYAAVAWPASDDLSSAILYTADEAAAQVVRTDLATGHHEMLELPGQVMALVVDQWNGTGRVLAVAMREETLRVVAWEFGVGGKADTVSMYNLPQGADSLIDAVALASSRDLALLLPGEDYWIVLTEGRVFWVRGAQGAVGPPRLVAAPSGLFLVDHLPDRGFVCKRIGEEPPPLRI